MENIWKREHVQSKDRDASVKMMNMKAMRPHGRMLAPGKIQKGKEPGAGWSLRSPSAARLHLPGFPARREKLRRKVGVPMVGCPSKHSSAPLAPSLPAAICKPGAQQPVRSRARDGWKLSARRELAGEAERESLAADPMTRGLSNLPCPALSAPMPHGCLFLPVWGLETLQCRGTE